MAELCICLWAGYVGKKCHCNVAVQYCWLGYTAALRLFFPITFTLRHTHASDTHITFQYIHPYFHWNFVTSKYITLFTTSRNMTMLAVVMWGFFASWPYCPVENLCCCLSFLYYPFTCSTQHLFLLCPTTFAINCCFSARIFLISILLPNTTSFYPSNLSLVVKDFSSCSFFSLFIKLILLDAGQIISWI